MDHINYTNFQSLFNRKLHTKFEECLRVSEEKSFKGVNGRTDGRWMMDREWSQKLNWAYGSGELKICDVLRIVNSVWLFGNKAFLYLVVSEYLW